MKPRVLQVLVWAAALFSILCAAELLHAAFAAFTHFECGRHGDYARYANMLWNTAHGRPFVYGCDLSYLKLHLSFTLVLLAPLFRVFDHPALLLVLQWLFLVAGGLCLAASARRTGVPALVTAAVLVFWTAGHFTQAILLREFHGVSLYLFLIPALYASLVAGKRWVWAPFLAILGLREEAGLVVVPLLLFFAVRERWRGGYVYAGLALAYVWLACGVLYPAINGIGLLESRRMEIQAGGGPAMSWWRLRSLLLVALPALPFLWRGWRALLVIPAVALLLTLASHDPTQVRLWHHYSAPVLACLGVALIEAARWNGGKGSRAPEGLLSGWLVVVSLVYAYAFGLVRGTSPEESKRIYWHVNPEGFHALRVLRQHVPPDGRLFTARSLQPFVAHRRDIVLRGTGAKHKPFPPGAVVAARTASLPAAVVSGLTNGSWTALYQGEDFVVARRPEKGTGGAGADP